LREYRNVRKYNSSLESALTSDNIPTSVYHSLIEGVHQYLPVLHRYLKLRKRMMGLKELHYYDMYPSLVKKVDMNYTVDQANDLIKTALAPLGKDYIATLDKAFNNRWIDVYPTTGKRSGAYSSGGAYGAHPFILLNFNGKYDDVSTMAHELGHTMHSYYSNKNQAYVNSHYPIFLAEVASITNESLLMDYVLKTDFSTLGICFGNQLLGKAVGGEVVNDNSQAEAGIQQVRFTEAGRGAQIFKNITVLFLGFYAPPLSAAP